MRPTYIAAAGLLSALSSNAAPVDSSRLGYQGPYFPISGAIGGVQPRLELRQLQQTGEMWNLYLLAMTEFQAMDQGAIGSWFQIAGIHGMPWTAWDGVEGSLGDDKDQSEKGYCPHNHMLFATWHRPYLALFEQQLQKTAIIIAETFPDADKPKYQKAALNLRTPYWDWAAAVPSDQPVIPTAMTDQTVKVIFGNGTETEIPNPLYEYRFHPLDNTQISGAGCPGNEAVCNKSQMTIRAGNTASDHPKLEKRIRAELKNQRKLLLDILSQYQIFDAFSNSGYCGGQGQIGDLELLHNQLHNNNWPGHMSPASVSAFDPMFWMHHANVDRQMALFQTLYPDTWMMPCHAETPTYTIKEGEAIDENSPLKPFHRTAGGEFWTSATVRNFSFMGYTYPELIDTDNSTLITNIKAQYSGASDVQVTLKKRSDDTLARNFQQRAASEPNTKQIYLAQVVMPIFGLDNGQGGASPYNVLVFVGNVSSDHTEWIGSQEFAGVAGVLGARKMRTNQTMVSSIDLSENLGEKITAGETTMENATEYLKENVHWRLHLGEKEIPRSSVKGIEVKLLSTTVEIADADDAFDHRTGAYTEHGRLDG
ncbi:Di-copper centre-containing protein [Pleomassaria siparia CBS 279.74]|uniref:tyrosinase n=1 Tax=Pleomassaria siparia CBS 279.74 TaxID=1314801 RepID=A0A6G1K394_9PLEO|nr:Di-copper centre-containing protein [Pleomassaria siparia CBS 279.74]